MAVSPPAFGSPIGIGDGGLSVPDNPIILFIEGDGTGPDIWRASQPVFDAAVEKAFGGKRRIAWTEILAGEKAHKATGEWLPDETVEAIRKYHVAIKGPLTTPVGGGIRSLNVALRQLLDLYACIRPVRYFNGVPSPVKSPEKLNVIIFRENTEDVYAGIEWKANTPETKKLIEFLHDQMGKDIRPDSGIGIKPISKFGTRRLVGMALKHALDKKLPSVTLVHKGNIMKFTEGAFRDWGYETADEEFGGKFAREENAADNPGLCVIKDRIADSMFQQVLLRPDEYSVLATANLNGDYLSDACAAQVGGLGLAPGANIGDTAAVFEATHGTAPKYAGKDVINPGSVILSGVMLLNHLGWDAAGDLIIGAVERTIANKTVTYDLHRQMPGATKVKCSEFGQEIIKNMDAVKS